MQRNFLRADYIPPEGDDKRGLLGSSEDEWEETSRFIAVDPRYRKRRLSAILFKFFKSPLTWCALFVIIVAIIGLLVLLNRDSAYIASLRYKGVPPGLYSRDGILYVGKDTPFHIKGFNWYGMEEKIHSPGGLHTVGIDSILDFAQEHNFNAIRFPLALDHIMKNVASPGTVATFANPDVIGQTYLEVAKSVIRSAASRKMLVLLDIHRLKAQDQHLNGLWYTDTVKEEMLQRAWKKLCDTFMDEWNIMGADLFNEPYKATWNTLNASDWKQTSEQLGNEIHRKCPSWVIFVEGVGTLAGKVKTNAFWAENLRAMQDNPPELKLKNKVVLSPHVYGPSVYNQSYFGENNFPENMPAIWDDHFGEANKVSKIATVIGEWGGFYVGNDHTWQNKIMKYINRKQIGFFYWCLNPESSDTGGLLEKDWKTPEYKKLALLRTAKFTKVADYEIHFVHWRYWRT